MKIAFIIRSLGVGGAETQLILLAQGLAEAGCRVKVITLYPFPEHLVLDFGRGVEFVSLEKKWRWDIISLFSSLRRELKEFNPDIIHGYLPTCNILSLLSAKLVSRSSKVVFGIRSSVMKLEEYDRLSRFTYWLEKKVAKFASAIIANSQKGAVPFFNSSKKVFVVPNGIDTDLYRPDESSRRKVREEWKLSEGTLAIGMVARIDPMKDHQTFISAAEIILRDNFDVRFICIGGGARSSLVSFCVNKEIDKSFIWCGPRHDLPDCYNALDIVVLASFGEGFPNVVAEAMSSGKRVVATDVGAVKEILGNTGRLIPVKDPAKLAEACLSIRQEGLQSDQNWTNICRDRVLSNFTKHQLVQRTVQILLEL